MEEGSKIQVMEISPKENIETTDSSNDSGKENNLPSNNLHDKEILNGQEPNPTVGFQSKILHNKMQDKQSKPRSGDVQKNTEIIENEENSKVDESAPSREKHPSTNNGENKNFTNNGENENGENEKDTNNDEIEKCDGVDDPNNKQNIDKSCDVIAEKNVLLKKAEDSDIVCEINDKLTNESKCKKNCESGSINSHDTDKDNKVSKLTVDSNEDDKKMNSVEKILDDDGDEFIITMNDDAEDSDVEEEMENDIEVESKKEIKVSSDPMLNITLPPLPPLPMKKNSLLVSNQGNSSAVSLAALGASKRPTQTVARGQNSKQNTAFYLTMNNASNSKIHPLQQKSLVQNKILDKSPYLPPALTPQSSTEMMSLIKWEISNRISNQRPKYQQNQPDSDLGPLAKFLFELGNDLVRETVYNDLVRIQTYRKSTGKLSEKETEDLCKLKDVQSELKYLVGPIKHNFKLRCKCGFRTESKNILRNHQEYPHVDDNDLSCAVCSDYDTKQPAAFMFHMEAMHNMRARIENKQAFWTCNLCPYENNSKSKLTQHRFRCLKNFNLKTNLSQNSVIGMEVNFCLENAFYKRKDPPKPFHNANTRQQTIAPKPKIQPSASVTVNSSLGTGVNKPTPTGRAPGDVTNKINTLISQNNLVLSQNKGPANEGGGFEVCEICGGYVKDRKALRIHFYYAHRKEIPDRAQAPLYCATCFARFWTAQGLQKHLEVHKVTNAAKCLICGHKVPNVLMHMRIVHTKELGNFLASCKCIYCGLVCSSKRGVESHMVGVHGIMIKTESIVSNPSLGIAPKQQKQPTPRGCMCVLCNLQFSRNVDLTRHCMKVHHTCMKCGMVVADKVSLDKHTCLKSIKGLRNCELCSEEGFHPAYHVKHIRDKHIRKCTIPLIRLPRWACKSVKDKNQISEIESLCKSEKKENNLDIDNSVDNHTSSKRPHSDIEIVESDSSDNISAESPSKKPCLDTSV